VQIQIYGENEDPSLVTSISHMVGIWVGVHGPARDLKVFKLAPKRIPAGDEAHFLFLAAAAPFDFAQGRL
jgi:hypothetical protein